MFDIQNYTIVVSNRICDCFQYVSFFNIVLFDLAFVIASSFALESWLFFRAINPVIYIVGFVSQWKRVVNLQMD